MTRTRLKHNYTAKMVKRTRKPKGVMTEQTPQGADPNLLLLMQEMLRDREAQIEEVRREREEERQRREEEARLQREEERREREEERQRREEEARLQQEEERHEREEVRRQREEETHQQLVVLQTLVKGIQMQGEVAAKKAERDN